MNHIDVTPRPADEDMHKEDCKAGWLVFWVYHLVMTNIAMERSTIFKNGKPSISMGHLYHGYVK